MKTLLTALSFVLLLAVGETKAFTGASILSHKRPITNKVKHMNNNNRMMPNTKTTNHNQPFNEEKNIMATNQKNVEDGFGFGIKEKIKPFAGSIAGAVSSITPALASTACCWGPAVLSAFGAAGATPLLSRISRYRPYLLGLSMSMISFSFYRAYGPPSKMEHACCKSEAQKKAHAKKLAINRAVVWASLAVAIYGATYGRVSWPSVTTSKFLSTPKNLWQAGTAGAGAGVAASSSLLKLHVQGMSCGGCATKVQKAIEGIHGVNNVVVDHKTGVAIVKGVGVHVQETMIKAAIAKLGYGVGGP